MKAAQTVIALGRTRLTAPWMIARARSPVVRRWPRALASSWKPEYSRAMAALLGEGDLDSAFGVYWGQHEIQDR